jgi:hypothetical protein
MYIMTNLSQENSVGTVTSHGIGGPGLKCWSEQGIFLFSQTSRLALGPTYPPVHWAPGLFFSGVMQPGCDTDHSPPLGAEAKNEWSYTLLHLHAFTVWTGITLLLFVTLQQS